MPSDKPTSPFLSPVPPPQPIRKRLYILSIGRLLIATVVLGSSLFISDRGKIILQIPSNTSLYLLIFMVYLFSLICLILIRKYKDSQWFIFIQILMDNLFITGFVHFSGGVESIFIFLYFFSIIAGALFLDRPKLFAVVALTTMFFFSSILKSISFFLLFKLGLGPFLWTYRFIFYKFLLHTISMWGVAVLTSFLSSELQKRKTQLIEKTKAYQSLERFNENILQSIISGILTLDSDNRITYINKAGKRILEKDESAILYQPIQEVFPALSEHLNEPFSPDETSHHYSVTYEQPGSSAKIIGFSLSTLFDAEKQPSGKIAIFQDLTSIKAMERRVNESEKLATIGRFAAALAHEIRNPLTSLSGSIQMLRDSMDLTGDDRELMDIVLRETQRLNRLVTDFLQFSRFGKENFQILNPYLLVEEIISVIQREHPEDRIHFENALPKDLTIHSDRDRLKQVFWNILTNAVQAKDKPEHKIIITGHLSESSPMVSSSSRFFTLTFQDNGKGIPDSILLKIFEPFFTTRSEGTGLGLSIAHQIVNTLGGAMTVTSQVGVGTTFKITLPV